MVKVKVVYADQERNYNVEYPKAYVRKIIDSENDLPLEKRAIKEIYVDENLVAKFEDGFVQELRSLVTKTTEQYRAMVHDAYVDRQEPIVAGCDVGQYAVSVDELAINLKDQIKAEEDWNAYQAEIAYPQKMLKENVWVTDHTGGNVEITYIPKSL
tara:strand:+ start:146 stop:613 length:468 start_codon:yes stop_codon:yes gene_type:complete